MTMSECENPPRELVKKLEQLGPEQVVDGYELCPQCDGLSPGIHMDGETIMHCSTCHDKHAVTVEEADRWRRAVANIYQREEESPTNGEESFRANQEPTSETSEKCPQCGGHTQAFAVMCGPRTPGGDDMKCTSGILACDYRRERGCRALPARRCDPKASREEMATHPKSASAHSGYQPNAAQ